MYKVIKTETQYKEYCDKLMGLAKKKETEKTIAEMELLEVLIDKWEQDNLRNEDMDPVELLKHLMENHNMERNELINILGISKGALSKILNYKKGLSKNVIRILSDHFKISQEAFNRPYPLISEANRGHRDEKMMNTPKELAEL